MSIVKKIETKQEAEKNKKKKQLTIGLVLVVVMFLSVIGYSFMGVEKGNGGGNDGGSGNNEKQVVYNGFTFNQQGNYWYLTMGESGYEFAFRHNPKQVERISTQSTGNNSLKLLNHYANSPLYLQTDSEEAQYEVALNLRNTAQRMQPACITEGECKGDYPIIGCDRNFIIIEAVNDPSKRGITQNGNCVFIRDKQENLTKMTDEFLFKIIGVEQ